MSHDDGQDHDPTEQARFEEDQQRDADQRYSDFLFEVLSGAARATYESQIGRVLS